MTKSPVLPLVDVSGLSSSRLADRLAVARELDRACADAGFLYIKGDQLDRTLFDRLVLRARSFFALDQDTKMASYIGRSENHSGYVPVGEEQFGEGSDDLKEAFDVNRDYQPADGRRPLLGPNVWPDIPGFQDDVQAYYRHVTDLGRQLFRAFALALGLNESHFDGLALNPPSQLRMIHYPFDASARDRPGIGSHTDYECFTLLFATTPGLQIVDRQGAWIDVPLIEGTMIMNIGDMMEILSNGRYVATRHRVKKVREDRYSFALFHSLDFDQIVEPMVAGEAPRYAPLKCGEHLYNQTAQTFAYLKRRVASGEIVLNSAVPLDSFGRPAAVVPA